MLKIIFLFLFLVSRAYGTSLNYSEEEFGSDFSENNDLSGVINEEFDSLLDQYRNLVPLESQDSKFSELIKEGQKLIQLGEREKGIALISKAWDMYPKNYKIGVFICTKYLEDKKYTKALENAKKIQERVPENTIGYKMEGMIYALQGDVGKAKKPFQRALQLRPGLPDVSHNLAAFSISEGDIETAESLYKDVLRYNPGFIPTLEHLGQLELNIGNNKEVISLLQEPVKNNPSEIKLSNILGQSYLAVGDFGAALKLSNDRIKKFPENTKALEINGIALFQTNQADKAVSVLKKVISKQPENIAAHYYLSKSYAYLQKYQEAILQLDLLYEVQPKMDFILPLKASYFYELKNYDKALKIVNTYKSKYPENKKIKELEFEILSAQNRGNEAIDLAQGAIKDNQASSALVVKLASALNRFSKTEQANKTLNNWLEDKPNDLYVRIYYAQWLFNKGNSLDAEIQYKEIIKQNPNIFIAHNDLAWLYFKRGDIDRAFKHATEANELQPNNPYVLDTLGQIYISKNLPEKGGEIFLQAIKNNPTNPQLHYYYSKFLFEVGNVNRAHQQIKTALSIGLPFAERNKAIELKKKIEKKN